MTGAVGSKNSRFDRRFVAVQDLGENTNFETCFIGRWW
ncbi:hypothetical protein SAMN05421636_106346 [Pricia antarctica]|uniref:Uncharacterized protein n=1 Tax=Pricia antarctica TaxID=641691 RepID=A0A1G7EW91_9FLAO|nr:hypothetical protein SAMN05421636_106346 [Pricia antarctica]